MNCIIAIIIVIIIIIIVYLSKYCVDNYDRLEFRVKSLFSKDYYNKKLNDSNDSPFYITETYNKDNSIDKFFSVSIYGTHPKYFNGLHNTMRKVEKDYPGWKLRVYAHEHIPEEYKNMLISNKNIETYIVHDDMIKPGNSAGMYWRFLSLTEPVTSISVDVDDESSSIGAELNPNVINKWLKSGKGFLRSILCPWSQTFIQGGGWGNRNFVQIPDIITNYPLRVPFGSDEIFLQKIVYPLTKEYGLMTYRSNNKHKLLFSLAPKNNKLVKYDNSNEVFV